MTKKVTNPLKIFQVGPIIIRVRAAANLINVNWRKTRLKFQLLTDFFVINRLAAFKKTNIVEIRP